LEGSAFVIWGGTSRKRENWKAKADEILGFKGSRK